MERGGRREGRCAHGCRPVLVGTVGGGRSARCLGCGQCGPVRPSPAEALAALREWPRRSLEEGATLEYPSG